MNTNNNHLDPKKILSHFLMRAFFTFFLGVLPFLNFAQTKPNYYDLNLLDYKASPEMYFDTGFQTFSDQGAWFSFGLANKPENYGGFVGPFLMTQENGVWLSSNACQLYIEDFTSKRQVDWKQFEMKSMTYRSHLIQQFESIEFKIIQTLFFTSSNSAYIYTQIINKTDKPKTLKFKWKIDTFLPSMKKWPQSFGMLFKSNLSDARIIIYSLDKFDFVNPRDVFPIQLKEVVIEPGEFHELNNGISVLLTGDDFQQEKALQLKVKSAFLDSLKSRKQEKNQLREKMEALVDPHFMDPKFEILLNKSLLTLQNNWRKPFGELKHEGLFPSYNFEDFYGFWALDSWKHAVALVYSQPELAKNQIRAIYDHQDKSGFIPGCINRDTTIKKHNFQNTNAPLSAWAISRIVEETADTSFLYEMYPKLLLQHNWWYENRDFDKDGLCEYGSENGSLDAAKKESGMFNAVRFDHSEILNRGDSVFCLNQESVDLNAYLYLEKTLIVKMAILLKDSVTRHRFENDSKQLKVKIQNQFFDVNSGWFYDTSIDGKNFVKVMGCEGWIPLWTNVASEEQAARIHKNMMNPDKFYKSVPFQSLSADEVDFKPENSYWRGSNWLGMAYFGIRGLHQYGFHEDAYKASEKLFRNAEGALKRGETLWENYNPLNGKGMEAKNFSLTAAHYLLLLINR